MTIAVPITAPTMQEAFEDIPKAAALADIVELRLDYLKERPDLEKLLHCSSKQVIVTVRHTFEGGKFVGTEKERAARLQEAIDLNAAYVDIELNHLPRLARTSQAKLIISYHNFKETPQELQPIYERIVHAGADIAKVVTMARSQADCDRMMGFVKQVSQAGNKIIGFCMGEQGKATRIIAPKYGSYLAYASLSNDKASASGQLTVAELRAAWEALGIK